MARKLMGISTGWIKPKHYGIDIEDGVEYIIIFSWWQKPITNGEKCVSHNFFYWCTESCVLDKASC